MRTIFLSIFLSVLLFVICFIPSAAIFLSLPAYGGGFSNGASTVGQLSDTDVSSPSNNDALTYQSASGNWEAVAGGSGETNTSSNQNAAGTGVFKQKTGVDFEFRGINSASNKITVVLDAANNEIDLDVAEGNIDHDATTNFTATEHFIQGAITSTTANWNANALQDFTVSTTDPTDDQVITFDAASSTYAAEAPAASGNLWSDRVDSDIKPDTDHVYFFGDIATPKRFGWFYASQKFVLWNPTGRSMEINVSASTDINFLALGGVVSYKFLPANTQILDVSTTGVHFTPDGTNSSLDLDTDGNVRIGLNGVTSVATDGYLYLPEITDGAPTGTPTEKPGFISMAYDDVNNDLCIYDESDSVWRCLTFD